MGKCKLFCEIDSNRKVELQELAIFEDILEKTFQSFQLKFDKAKCYYEDLYTKATGIEERIEALKLDLVAATTAIEKADNAWTQSKAALAAALAATTAEAAPSQQAETTPGAAAQHRLAQFGPVGHPGAERAQRRMGRDAEDAAAQLAFEAVHHGEHDDQDRHAQHQTGHRDQRDEGHEAAAVRRAQVTGADQPFVAGSHAGAHSYRKASAGATREARSAGYTVAAAVISSAALPIDRTLDHCSSEGMLVM